MIHLFKDSPCLQVSFKLWQWKIQMCLYSKGLNDLYQATCLGLDKQGIFIVFKGAIPTLLCVGWNSLNTAQANFIHWTNI